MRGGFFRIIKILNGAVLPNDTNKREVFYWTTILFTFALGTATGDLATEEFRLGFRWGVVIFSVLITLVAVAQKWGANKVLTFWAAYILTRPLGASLGDLLSQAKDYGGFGWGAKWTSFAFLVVIVVVVAVVTFSQNRTRLKTV